MHVPNHNERGVGCTESEEQEECVIPTIREEPGLG